MLSRYDLLWWIVPEKSRSVWSVLDQNIDISFGQNGAPLGALWWSTQRAVLLLASFDVALLSKRENPSWINWIIETSSSMHWVWLRRFPVRRSRFQASHHSTYCGRLSSTSYRPVVHTCSHFGARVRCRHMLCEIVLVPLQVLQHFDAAQGNGSLFAPPIALISFTMYVADKRTQEFEPNRSRNRVSLKFCLINDQSPHWSRSSTIYVGDWAPKMSGPSWQWHRTGNRWSPVFEPYRWHSCGVTWDGNKAAANLRFWRNPLEGSVLVTGQHVDARTSSLQRPCLSQSWLGCGCSSRHSCDRSQPAWFRRAGKTVSPRVGEWGQSSLGYILWTAYLGTTAQ